VSNAIKFTKTGGSITVSAKSAGKGRVEICVKDNGTGMKQEEIQKLFRIDQSDSKAGTAGETGTGLGLILCKEFVEKMDGRISVESAVGTGTAVCFSLPGEE
jgi:two-component system sensor histidine kinase/response regulator